jgi:hypothetical protein
MTFNWKIKFREKARSFFWHGYWTDPAIFFSLLLAFLANVGIWIALRWIVGPTDQLIILHYNVYFGVDSIGDWRSVFLMPALAGGLMIVNLFLSRFFYYKERLVSYLFAGMALLIQLLMIIGVASVIIINF